MNNRKTNILIVDDDHQDRKLVKAILAKSGQSGQFSVEDAGTLSEAIICLKNGQYDIMLLDLNLPDSRGIDTVQSTKKATSDVSIVVLTGIEDEETGIQAIRKGADDFLIKGRSLEHMLVRTIRYSLERKYFRQQLAETENRFRTLVQTAGSAIFVLSPENRILEWNEQAENLYGWQRQDILNKDYLELFVPEETRDKVSSDIKEVLLSKTAKSFENLICTRDGSQRILLWNISPLFDAVDQSIGIIAVGQDITDRKDIEDELREHRRHLELMVNERTANLQRTNEQLRIEIEDRKKVEQQLLIAKREAEAANQFKSEFLANMSHELRTPLHSILSFASFGIKKYAISEPEKLLDYFNRIKQSGKTLLDLLNDLLDLSKLESGKTSFIFKSTCPVSLIRSVINEFEPLIAERSLRIRFEEDEFDGEIELDAEKIKQVLRNILDNAIKFSPERGFIDIKIYRFEKSLKVSIRDQGLGIPQNELATVFDKFVQSSKTKTGAGGTGLGLAICREIISGHKGRIWAENMPESGVMLSFELPLSITTNKQNELLLRSADKSEEIN